MVHEFNTKGRCETQLEFSKIDKKGIAKKNVRLFTTKDCLFKSGKDKKTGDAKVGQTKKSENHRNHKEGQTEQDKMCTPKKINKENKVKKWEKGNEKTKRETSKRKTRTRGETKREVKREKRQWKKRDNESKRAMSNRKENRSRRRRRRMRVMNKSEKNSTEKRKETHTIERNMKDKQSV